MTHANTYAQLGEGKIILCVCYDDLICLQKDEVCECTPDAKRHEWKARDIEKCLLLLKLRWRWLVAVLRSHSVRRWRDEKEKGSLWNMSTEKQEGR